MTAFWGFKKLGCPTMQSSCLPFSFNENLVLQQRSCFQPKYWVHLILSLVIIFIVKFFAVNDCSNFLAGAESF